MATVTAVLALPLVAYVQARHRAGYQLPTISQTTLKISAAQTTRAFTAHPQLD